MSSNDTVLAKLVQLSQIGLFSLAVFGYFYTVVPVYERALLTEQVAQKTLELNRKNEEIAAKNIELAKINKNLSKTEAQLEQYAKSLDSSQKTLQDQYNLLRAHLILQFTKMASNCSIPKIGNRSFVECIKNDIISRPSFSRLSQKDKELILQLSGENEAPMRASIEKINEQYDKKREDLASEKAKWEAEYEQAKKSPDYEIRTKKATTDLYYGNKLGSVRGDEIRISLNEGYDRSDVLSNALKDISTRFINNR